MIQIICIKWGDLYSPEYVNKLYRSISRNSTKPYEFTCYCNNREGILDEINVIPIPKYTGDWYSKISLYNKTLYNPDDQIFYFDLDTVIINNIDDLLEYEGNFILLRDFYIAKFVGSGLMSWKPEAVDHLYHSYKEGTVYPRGDQTHVYHNYKNPDIWQELYPEKIISYKVHVVGDGKPLKGRRDMTNLPGTLETASIVCFHGTPRPHEITEDWLTEHWK